MKKIFVAIAALSFVSCIAQSPLNVIPEPAKAEIKQGTFTLTPSTKILLSGSNLDKSVNFFNSYLKKYYGFELKTSKQSSDHKNVIELNYDRLDNSLPGAY